MQKAKRTGRILSILLVVAMLISTILIAPTTVSAASAGDLREGRNYIIVARHSGKALTVKDFSTDNNAQIVQLPVGNYTSQVWTLDYDDNGYYQIVNVHSGKALDVPWASTDAGTRIVQFNKGNADNQKWKITDAGNGYCRIAPKLVANFGLNIEGAYNTDGAALIQWNYGGANNEVWEFREVSTNGMSAYPSTDSRLAVDSFINKFTYQQNGKYVLTKSGTIWSAAETIEVIIDAYEHFGDQKYKTVMCDLVDWYIGNNGENWSNNKYNDDVMWAVIMCTRTYRLTGDAKYLSYAINNFNMCYDRAWSGDLGGGLWWTTDKTTKNACVNGPGAIAACLLGDTLGNDSYYSKAKAIMDWEIATLAGDDGGIWDSYNTNREYNKWVSSYNQGTFIGACTMLYKHYGDQNYYNWAKKAADRSTQLDMNGEQSGGDLIGFKGILARWMGYFVEQCNVNDYNDWMRRTAGIVWTNRNSDNLMWTQFRTKTEDNIENSADDNKRNNAGWGCSPAVSWLVNCTGQGIAVNSISGTIDPTARYRIVSRESGKCLDVEGGSNDAGANVIQWSNNGGTNQMWYFDLNSDGSYTLRSARSGKVIDVEDNSKDAGGNVIVWNANGQDNQRWWVTNLGNGYYSIISKNSGMSIDVYENSKDDGGNVIQWGYHGGENQQWQLQRVG